MELGLDREQVTNALGGVDVLDPGLEIIEVLLELDVVGPEFVDPFLRHGAFDLEDPLAILFLVEGLVFGGDFRLGGVEVFEHMVVVIVVGSSGLSWWARLQVKNRV